MFQTKVVEKIVLRPASGFRGTYLLWTGV